MNCEARRRRTLANVDVLDREEKKYTARKGFFLDCTLNKLMCYKCGHSLSLYCSNQTGRISAHVCSSSAAYDEDDDDDTPSSYGSSCSSRSSRMFSNCDSPKNSACVSRYSGYPVKQQSQYKAKSPSYSSAVAVPQGNYHRKINYECEINVDDDVVERRCQYREVIVPKRNR